MFGTQNAYTLPDFAPAGGSLITWLLIGHTKNVKMPSVEVAEASKL